MSDLEKQENINIRQLEFGFYGRSPERVGRDERNMMEWLVGVLSDTAPEGVHEIVYRDVIQTEKAAENKVGGKKRPLERVWRVQVTEGRKLPSATERDILVALSSITPQDPEAPQTVFFTVYELCKIMRKAPNGQNYERIAEGLQRLKATNIVAENAFYDKSGNRYRTVETGIFQDIGIADRQAASNHAKSWVTWTRIWRLSIEAGYYWILDLDFYFSLKKPLERRLFQLLNGKKKGNEERGFTIDLKKWAHEHVGVSRKQTMPQVKRHLDTAHRTLQRRGFLADWRYEHNASGGWQVHYDFARGTAEEPVALPDGARALPARANGDGAPPAADESPEEMRAAIARSMEHLERQAVERRDEELLGLATDADRAEGERRLKAWWDANMQLPKDRNSRLWQGSLRSRVVEAVRERLGEDASPEPVRKRRKAG